MGEVTKNVTVIFMGVLVGIAILWGYSIYDVHNVCDELGMEEPNVQFNWIVDPDYYCEGKEITN